MRFTRFLCISPILFVVLATSIAAADIAGVTNIAYVGDGVEFFPEEIHLIDGSGLSGPVATEADFDSVTHAAASTDNAWVTDDPYGADGDYLEDPIFGPAGTIIFEFTLDDTYNLNQMAAWGYHFGGFNGNAMSEVTLEFSTDGGATFDSTQTGITVAQSAGEVTISEFTPTDANFVRLTVTDNYFGAPDTGGGDRVGLAEVRFATGASAGVMGDANGDGNFDFGDIEAFFLALTDPGAYATQFPTVSISLLDMNADGNTDFADIEAFFTGVTGG